MGLKELNKNRLLEHYKQTWKNINYHEIKCVYDKDHMSALRIKNTSDPHSYEVT